MTQEVQPRSSNSSAIKCLFLDCGDTLIDETTEVKLPNSEVVTKADFIPGAQLMMEELSQAGYKLILVADGPQKTFENLLKPSGIWDRFSAHIISQNIGELKPSQKMFDAALEAAGLKKSDAGACVMLGNNLSRDIKGANIAGMISVLLGWSKKRSHAPADALEIPDHSISELGEFLPLLREIESQLSQGTAQ